MSAAASRALPRAAKVRLSNGFIRKNCATPPCRRPTNRSSPSCSTFFEIISSRLQSFRQSDTETRHPKMPGFRDGSQQEVRTFQRHAGIERDGKVSLTVPIDVTVNDRIARLDFISQLADRLRKGSGFDEREALIAGDLGIGVDV